MTTRITTYEYDWRGRQIAIHGEEGFAQRTEYDNLDRPIRVERYDTVVPAAGSSSSSSSSSGGTVGNLISRADTKYDARGRVYQTHRYAVNPQTGEVGNALIDRTWYDASGRVIKQQPAGSQQFTKFQYDSLGRQVKQFIGYDTDESTFAEAASITDDTILEQIETDYDAAGNAIQTTHRQRYHNATGTGELGTPSSGQPKARVTYVAMYHDAIGRRTATADYGTNGGSSLSRSATIPARSDTILVSSTAYNAAGQVATTTSPRGIDTCFEYDAVGRQTKQIQNCVEASSSSSGQYDSDDLNVTVETAYNADGNVRSITAKNPITGDQVTQYVYGTTLSDSGIASSQLKRAEIYPDSDDMASPLGNGPDETYDRIEFKYNRQGEVVEIKDQNETVRAFNYDGLGRRTEDRVITVGSGVDDAVRRISTTYEIRGLREKLTSWDNATVGSGDVVNEVLFAYNDFGQLITEYQAHGGSVNTSTTPKVQYGYADGSNNTIRPTSLTYPSGRVITYDYGAANSAADAVGRIASIIDDDVSETHLADYTYLGLGTFVEVDYTEPDIKYTLGGLAAGNDPDTGDIYHGLDRFGRV
ncbi:MAG: hypothetical protein KDA47_23800, partial [Planctomycetales bacterium]|nr:hypothetical protein [Planctomycetales bacterium]